MKGGAIVVALLALAASAAQAAKMNPISKVLELLSGMETKLISEGEASKKVYSEYAEFCEDRSRELQYSIKTAKAEVSDLKAVILKETADMEALESKIDDLGSSNAEAESLLKEATATRTSEAKDFAAEEKDLLETISALERAMDILEREASKASFAQMQGAGNNLIQAFAAMVQAAALSSADASKLTALVQENSESDSDDEDSEVNAPDPAVYESHTGGIIDTLSSLEEKAQEQLAELRKKETEAIHAYELEKQSLEDQIKFATQDMDEAKKELAAAGETKANAEGDLETTTKALEEDIKSLAELHHDCMEKATDFESEMSSRGEELKSLAAAKKVIGEMTGGAEDLTYSFSQDDNNDVSFLQVAAHQGSPGTEAVRLVRRLAKKHGSVALAQLSKRMESALHLGARVGDDPFAKVKGLITDMISRLEADASADASLKAYCDKETGESTEKKDDLSAEIEKLTVRMDLMVAESKKLKEEIVVLQKELAELAATQAEMDKLRAEEKAVFDENSPEMEAGIEGTKLALKILREYYAKEDKDHDAAEGAGASVIGLLEVAESDFSKLLAEMKSDESAAVAKYEEETKENEVNQATKDKDVKYKTANSAFLDKKVAEIKADLDGLHTELSAVLDYLKQLEEKCIAKPETYEERKKAREQELEGLKEALDILENEAALLQTKTTHRTLRGHVHLHPESA